MRRVATGTLPDPTAVATILPTKSFSPTEGGAPVPGYPGVRTMRPDDERETFHGMIGRPRTDVDTDGAAAQIRGQDGTCFLRGGMNDQGAARRTDTIRGIAKKTPQGKGVIDARTTPAGCRAQSGPVV